jgi:hypothetical protein
VGSLLQGSKGGTLTPAYHASRIFIGGLSGNAKKSGIKTQNMVKEVSHVDCAGDGGNGLLRKWDASGRES